MKKDIYLAKCDTDLEYIFGQLLYFSDKKVKHLFIFEYFTTNLILIGQPLFFRHDM